MRTKYTSGMHQQVRQLRDQGESYRAIARQLGLSHSTVLAGVSRWSPTGKREVSQQVEDLVDELLGLVATNVAGPPWTAAGLRSTLSAQQLQALRRYCEQLVLWVEGVELVS